MDEVHFSGTPVVAVASTSCSAARRQQRTSTTRQFRATNEPAHTSRTFSIPRHNTTQRERSTQQKQRMTKSRSLDSAEIDPKHTSPRDEPHCTPLDRTPASENKIAFCKKFPFQPVQNQRKTRRKDNLRNSTPQYTSRTPSTRNPQKRNPAIELPSEKQISSSHKFANRGNRRIALKPASPSLVASCARAHGVSGEQPFLWN